MRCRASTVTIWMAVEGEPRARKTSVVSCGVARLLAARFVIGGATSASAGTAADQYCIITVTKSVPGKPEAKVVDQPCGVTRQAAAAKRPALKASVLLVQLFQHANQNAGAAGWRAGLVADAECGAAAAGCTLAATGGGLGAAAGGGSGEEVKDNFLVVAVGGLGYLLT